MGHNKELGFGFEYVDKSMGNVGRGFQDFAFCRIAAVLGQGCL